MKNPEMYIGYVLTSQDQSGATRVSTNMGLAYKGLDDLQVTMIQSVLADEFGSQFFQLLGVLSARLNELGFDAAELQGTPAADVTAAKGLAKGKAK